MSAPLAPDPSPHPAPDAAPLGTALALWQALAAQAGIEQRLPSGRPGRDFDLQDAILDELLARTGIDRRGRPLAELLAQEPQLMPIELLLRCALGALRPFGTMMSDVLKTLAAAGAHASGDALRVRFALGDGTDPLDQTLDQFREAVERITRALVLAEPLLPPAAVLDEVRDVLQQFGAEAGDWPRLLQAADPAPPLDPSGSPAVDAALDDLRRAINATRRWIRENDAVNERFDFFLRLQDQLRADPGNAVLAGQKALALLCADYLEVALFALVRDAGRQVAAAQIDPAALLAALAPLLDRLPRLQQWVTTATQALTDILNLPVWAKRSELYAVWIGCRLLRVIDAKTDDLRLHAPGGVLSFAFSGALLGTCTCAGRPHEVWCELQTPLTQGTLFKARTAGIQPDFRVTCEQHFDRNDDTRLVVECKHYLAPSAENFVAAADDYARNCRHATVLVVNHGRLDPVALAARLRSPVQDRTSFLGDVVPQRGAAGLKALEDAIGQALFPAVPQVSAQGGAQAGAQAGAHVGEEAGEVSVEWEGAADVDLSLEHVDPQGRRSRVDYASAGSLSAPPFARLVQDVRTGPGPETITVARWLPGVYEVRVADYGKTAALRPGSVRCRIVFAGSGLAIAFPGRAPANAWRVARIDTAARTVEVLNLTDGEG